MNETVEKRKLAYNEAAAVLKLHPPLIWTRNNFFLLINSGLFAFAATKPAHEIAIPPYLVPLAGIFLSLIWIWVTYAGTRLQREWRRLVIELEKELFKAADGEPSVEGPYTRAARITNEGASLRVSINTALLVLATGFLCCWIGMLIHPFRALCASS